MKIAIFGMALAGIILLCSMPSAIATSCEPACDSKKTFCSYEHRDTEIISTCTWWYKSKCYWDTSGHHKCLWVKYQKQCVEYDLWSVCQLKRYCCTTHKWEALGDPDEDEIKTGVTECKTTIIDRKELPYGQSQSPTSCET